MTVRGRRRALRKLEEIKMSDHLELRFKNGEVKKGYVYDLDEGTYGDRTSFKGRGTNYASLYITSTPVSADSADHGSMVDPRDWLPNIPLRDLGYVLVIDRNVKISCMPFHS